MSHDPNLSDPCYPNVAFIINAVPILQELDKKYLLSTLAWAINFQFKNKNWREDGNTCGFFVLINFNKAHCDGFCCLKAAVTF